MEPPFYRPSFSKHLHSLARSNYFSRGLDADDRQFLEYVRKHGIANGSLPNNSAVLLEELEFWHFPYSVAPGIERRVGRRPRPAETPETAELRHARSNAWHARRIIRENEKAIAEAEVARERREWEAAQQKRKVRELISDAEWEAAAPRHASFGETVGRRYVPRWKLDEQGIAQWKADEQGMVEQAVERAKTARKRKKLKLRAEEIAWARDRGERVALEQKRRDKWAKVLKKARKARLGLEQEAERKRREAVIAEARQTVDRLNRMEREWQGTGTAYTADSLKQAILTLLNSTPGQVWTRETMMRPLGCTDAEFINNCLEELVRSGRLRKVDA